jgi:hypothetical protein
LVVAAASVGRLTLVQTKKYVVLEIAVVSHMAILGGLLTRGVAA